MNINSKLSILGLFFTAVCFAGVAQAGTVLNIGLAAGGDDLEPFASGDKFLAGSGFLAELGWESGTLEDPVSYQLLMGVKFNAATAESTTSNETLTADIISYPVHALALFKQGKFSLGGGLAYYLAPSYSPLLGGKVDFDNALGYVLGGNFNFGGVNRAHVGLRYTNISFKGGDIVGNSGSTIDASSLALVFGFNI